MKKISKSDWKEIIVSLIVGVLLIGFVYFIVIPEGYYLSLEGYDLDGAWPIILFVYLVSTIIAQTIVSVIKTIYKALRKPELMVVENRELNMESNIPKIKVSYTYESISGIPETNEFYVYWGNVGGSDLIFTNGNEKVASVHLVVDARQEVEQK